MADQAVLKYLSIDTTFDPCYLSLDSTFKYWQHLMPSSIIVLMGFNGYFVVIESVRHGDGLCNMLIIWEWGVIKKKLDKLIYLESPPWGLQGNHYCNKKISLCRFSAGCSRVPCAYFTTFCTCTPHAAPNENSLAIGGRHTLPISTFNFID